MVGELRLLHTDCCTLIDAWAKNFVNKLLTVTGGHNSQTVT
jgi:hypothetical protein